MYNPYSGNNNNNNNTYTRVKFQKTGNLNRLQVFSHHHPRYTFIFFFYREKNLPPRSHGTTSLTPTRSRPRRPLYVHERFTRSHRLFIIGMSPSAAEVHVIIIIII